MVVLGIISSLFLPFSHWLFDEPRLMYMHWETVGDPFTFAKNSFDAAREVGIF
ncbi:DUF1259 domain-containing protein [Neobacillus drentensis]|uniref:DUF1259 domain-containing protein n=1 Tax=Neobacillus drentensis TaxID=220684 RepID=UPI002FFFBE2F